MTSSYSRAVRSNRTPSPRYCGHVRLTDATEDDQETAIRAWLDTHPPTPLMTHSLNRNGYGHLLNGGGTDD